MSTVSIPIDLRLIKIDYSMLLYLSMLGVVVGAFVIVGKKKRGHKNSKKSDSNRSKLHTSSETHKPKPQLKTSTKPVQINKKPILKR